MFFADIITLVPKVIIDKITLIVHCIFEQIQNYFLCIMYDTV